MDHKIHNALNDIKADSSVKEHTLNYIKQYQKKPGHQFLPPRYAAVLSCLLLFFCIAGFSYRNYFSPVSYIDIDVNPSVELILNRYGKVIDTSAYNDDGKQILSALDLKYKSYEKALSLLITAMNEDGYIVDNGLISVTLQSDNSAEPLLSSIQNQVDSILVSHHIFMEQDIYLVDAKTRMHAHNRGLSPAKYAAIMDLQAVDPTVTIEECHNRTISELRQYTKAHRDHTDDDTGNRSQNHHGSTSGNDTHNNRQHE